MPIWCGEKRGAIGAALTSVTIPYSLCAVWQPHHKMLVKICCEAVHKHPTRMPWTHASVRPLTASRSVATTMELEL